ncbi:transcription factor adf-1 [Plakobranchus ocellatus]|uniref:Transcription factor adf-1 n=1 Tax=Plakobranchus ocellatus TaxID=259542 RepID=A0AAV4CVL2_9GAST|nr:transcription factor adf-1 [Plakobranchus ocellatus]
MDNCNELLIAAVEKRTALYDKTGDNYSNRVCINKQWIEIEKEIGIDGNAARKKWTTLRDYFYKTNKQLKTIQSGAAADKRRKWYLYDAMKFLLPHITDRKTTSNLSEVSDNEGDDCSQMSETAFQSLQCLPSTSQSLTEPGQSTERNTTDTQPNPSPSSRAASPATNLIARPTTNKRRAPYPQQRGQNASMDDKILDAIMSMNNKPHVEEKDDCDHFLQSLARQLRSLGPLARYKCQAEIQMLILRHLEESQTSTSSFSHAGGQYQHPLNQHYNYNNDAFNQYQTYSP